MNDDLPTTLPPGTNSPSDVQDQGNVFPVSGSGVSGKEKEMGGSNFFDLESSGTSVEAELPKEVASFGVRTQPTTVKLPPVVQSMGVIETGSSTQMSNGSTVTLPLTDIEIADGLKQGFTSSWRWLSEWCVFQLKKLGLKK
jgi:hypothetical protein